MRFHTVIDTRTGDIKTIGKDGREYSPDEIDAAQRLAELGDPDAQATLANIERSDYTDVDPMALMRQMLHDCPECRAAMAAGEVPVWGIPEPAPKKRKLFPRLPRWRSRKRGG